MNRMAVGALGCLAERLGCVRARVEMDIAQ
jgi:hypothetical protein